MSKHMMTNGPKAGRRPYKVLGATVALVAISGTAFAYWTTTGTGVGSADTGTAATVTVVQTSVVTDLAPGSAPQQLSGTITNPSSGPVYVTAIDAVVSSVTKAVGAAAGTCTAADYTIAGTGAVGAEMPADDSGTWGNLTIAFNNDPGANQDACKDAQLVIGYTAS